MLRVLFLPLNETEFGFWSERAEIALYSGRRNADEDFAGRRNFLVLLGPSGVPATSEANSRLEMLEALGRVELPTNGLGNRCSIHLSYRAGNVEIPQSLRESL